MYITKDFIFIHIPKTGGTSILSTIKQQYVQLNYQRSYHDSIENIKPTLIGNKPIFAFVRNPYSWYVSWYISLQRMGRGCSVLFDLINTNNFNHDLNTLFDMFDSGVLVDKFVREYNVNKHHAAGEYANEKTFLQSTNWNNCGLLSWHYHWQLFGNENTDHHDYTKITIGKLENFVEDQLSFFRKINLLTTEAENTIIQNERINTSTQEPFDYRTYYDNNLIERVAQKEQYITDRYNYYF